MKFYMPIRTSNLLIFGKLIFPKPNKTSPFFKTGISDNLEPFNFGVEGDFTLIKQN